MIEIDKKLHKEIKEYCRLNNLVMKEYVNSLLKKAFTSDKFGDTPFKKTEEVNPTSSDYEPPVLIKPILSTDYETPEPVETVPDISKKEVPNKFYNTLQYDELWKEKLEENIENGSIMIAPYVFETNSPAIIVNHSKEEEEASAQADKVKKEEKQKKPKKRNL